MKANSNPTPCKADEGPPTPRTRLGRLKKSLKDLKKKVSGKDHKTKVKNSGVMKGQWRQDELPKIVKKIVDNNPGLTDIEIYSNEIRWHCEINYFDLFPTKRSTENPSKREEKD